MTYAEAIMQTIVYFETAYTDENARARKWKKWAEQLGVAIAEDADITEARKQRQLEAAAAEFL